MANWNKKVEKKSYGSFYFIADIRLGEEVRKSQRSDYHMIRLLAMPAQDQAGLSASGNVMFHPDWLGGDFDPADIQPDLKDLAAVRSKRKLGAELDEEEQKVLDQGSQSFVFERNVYSERGNSILQGLLGPNYGAFMSEIEDDSPESFASKLKTTFTAQDKPLFIVKAKQSKDQDDELTDRFEIDQIIRIEDDQDMERFKNYRDKNADVMFDIG